MSENKIETTIETPMPEQLKEAAGCGCFGIPVAIFGPILTNMVGITPWPIPVMALIYAGIAYSTTSPLGKMHRKTNFSLALVLLAFSLTSAVMTTRDNSTDLEQSKPHTTPEIEKASPPITQPDARVKEEVRIGIDEIIQKYARN